MSIEDTLRDALQTDAAELEPVGPGPDDARRRAFRRKRRMQSGVVVASAVVLVGGTLGFIQARSGGDDGTSPKILANPGVVAPDLSWRTVDGTVLYAAKHVTTADGVTYALSTAPGKQADPAAVVPQELYSSRDGVAWTHTSLGATPWVNDLAEGNGVLYAVGTGPGTQGNPVDYKLSTSANGGAKWDDTPVPVKFAALQTSLHATLSTTMHVARGPHTTVVMAKASYQVSLGDVLGNNPGSFRFTATGVDIIDYSECKLLEKQRTTIKACDGAKVDQRSWAQLGIANPEALNQQIALVREDGHDWQTVPLPVAADTAVWDVTATTSGFVMAEQQWGDGPGRNSTLLFSSPDGRTWTPMAGVPAVDTVSLSGDRIIGGDSATSTLYVSNDAGVTWTPTPDVGALIPGSDPVNDASNLESGPLGYAVIVHTGNPPTANAVDKDGTPVTAPPTVNADHAYLLHSADGSSWKVTDLDTVGAPATGWPTSVTVGADHIEVTYEVPKTEAGAATDSSKLVTLIATPKA